MAPTTLENVTLAFSTVFTTTLKGIAAQQGKGLEEFMRNLLTTLASGRRLPKGELPELPEQFDAPDGGLTFFELPVSLTPERKGALVQEARDAGADYVCPLEEMAFLFEEVLREKVAAYVRTCAPA